MVPHPIYQGGFIAVNTAALLKMGTEDLRALNDAIVQVLRQRHTDRQRSEMRRFGVGDVVRFVGRGSYITARITKYNQKTVSCVQLDVEGHPTKQTWRVAPTLLQAVAG